MHLGRYAVVAAIWGSMAVSAHAIVLTYDFEAPDYAAGSVLTDGNGWQSLAGGGSTGVINTDIVKSGTQAVKLTRVAADPATFGAYIPHTGLIPTPENPIVRIEWDMYALTGSVGSDMWGVSDYSGLERMTVGINASNKLTLRNAAIGTVVTGVSIARNSWNHYRMDVNYLQGKAGIYFNGGFVGEWNVLNGPNEHTSTALFNRGFSSDDGAIFDNLTVSANNPVPEPATIAASLVGIAGLRARRRRK